MQKDLLKKAIENNKSRLEKFPISTFFLDIDFNVVWFNESAKENYEYLTTENTIKSILEEYDSNVIISQLKEKGSYTISEVIPFSVSSMAFAPILHDQELIGIEIYLANANTSSNLAHKLCVGLRKSITEIFSIMDYASEKADILDTGWINSHFEQIGHLNYQILRITDNVSAYATIQNNTFPFYPTSIDFIDMLNGLSKPIAAIAKSANIPVVFNIPQDVVCINIDRASFELAFFNIIHNALYYTRKNNEITIEINIENDNLILSIRDKGIGIPEDIIQNVFTPYFNYDKSEKNQSIGLGLAVAKSIVRIHGFYISINSQLDVGTNVDITFPINNFSKKVSLGQKEDSFLASDRFSRLYSGLGDINISPYKN